MEDSESLSRLSFCSWYPVGLRLSFSRALVWGLGAGAPNDSFSCLLRFPTTWIPPLRWSGCGGGGGGGAGGGGSGLFLAGNGGETSLGTVKSLMYVLVIKCF